MSARKRGERKMIGLRAICSAIVEAVCNADKAHTATGNVLRHVVSVNMAKALSKLANL